MDKRNGSRNEADQELTQDVERIVGRARADIDEVERRFRQRSSLGGKPKADVEEGLEGGGASKDRPKTSQSEEGTPDRPAEPGAGGGRYLSRTEAAPCPDPEAHGKPPAAVKVIYRCPPKGGSSKRRRKR